MIPDDDYQARVKDWARDRIARRWAECRCGMTLDACDISLNYGSGKCCDRCDHTTE